MCVQKFVMHMQHLVVCVQYTVLYKIIFADFREERKSSSSGNGCGKLEYMHRLSYQRIGTESHPGPISPVLCRKKSACMTNAKEER